MNKKLLLVALCALSALTMHSPIESKTRRTRTQQQTQNVGLEKQAQVEEIQKLTGQARKGENLDQATIVKIVKDAIASSHEAVKGPALRLSMTLVHMDYAPDTILKIALDNVTSDNINYAQSAASILYPFFEKGKGLQETRAIINNITHQDIKVDLLLTLIKHDVGIQETIDFAQRLSQSDFRRSFIIFDHLVHKKEAMPDVFTFAEQELAQPINYRKIRALMLLRNLVLKDYKLQEIEKLITPYLDYKNEPQTDDWDYVTKPVKPLSVKEEAQAVLMELIAKGGAIELGLQLARTLTRSNNRRVQSKGLNFFAELARQGHAVDEFELLSHKFSRKPGLVD